MNKIVIINGHGKVGKDQFIKLIDNNIDIYTMNISSVDNVKLAATILGWNGEKDEKTRKFLSDIKKLSIQYNDHPLNYSIEKIEEFYHYCKTFRPEMENILFIHIREPEEIQKLVDKTKELFNIKPVTLLITNKNTKEILSNNSDKSVYEYEYDYYINNDHDLDYLQKESEKFLKWLFNDN